VTVSDSVNSCTALASAGTCNITMTTTGPRTLVATYAGTAEFAGSTSPGEPHVNGVTSSVSITGQSPNPSGVAQSVALTATVTGGSGTPTGTVQFKDNGSNIGGPVTLDASGAATLNFAFSAAGNHPITAVYAGGGVYLGSTSAPVSQVVK